MSAESWSKGKQVAESDGAAKSDQTNKPSGRSGSSARSSSASSLSRSPSFSSRSSQSSCSSGSRGRRHSSRSSSERSYSRSRSRSHPRCHRRSYSRGRWRHRCSPPRRYRARSRSYSRTPTPSRWRRSRRSRSTSRGRRLYGFVGRSRFISSPFRRSRSRSRSRDRSNIHLSLDEKRELLRIAQANAAKALGVETLELPASVRPILEAPGEGDHKKLHQIDVDDEVPSPKASPTNISFNSNNTVAKPISSTPSVQVNTLTGLAQYGQWVPVKARSFPVTHMLTKPL